MTEMTLKPMSDTDREFIEKANDLLRRIQKPKADRPVDLTPNGVDTEFLMRFITRASDAIYDNNVGSNALAVYARDGFWTTVLPNTSAAEDKGATARWAQSMMDPV